MSNNQDMIKLVKLLEGSSPKFAGEPAQKPGDQVRGTDVAKTGGKDHPFKDRLVGEDTTLEDTLSKKYQDFKDVQAKDAVKKKDKTELDEADYDDEDDYDEDSANGFFVCIGSEEDGGFVGMVTKDGGKWRESNVAGNAPYSWGGKSYMSYLSADEIMSYIRNDYGRHADVKGPFYDEDDAMEYAQHQYGLGESITEGHGTDINIGDPVEITGDVQFKGATGDVAAFNQDHSFVIVDLYNHGKRSFHVSDVSFNEYAGSDEEEARMYDAGEFRDNLDEDFGDSPVASAITRRILLQRTDLLSKYGPEKVGAAVDEVADFVGDVDEIGSSDVSGWIRHVEQMLGNMNEQGVAEGSKEKTPGIALSKAYKKDFDDKKPGQDRKETALTGAYSKTGKPGGELKKQGVAEGDDIGYHQTSGTKAGHTVSSRKLSNKPQASNSDVTLQSGSMHHRGKSYNFPKGTLFTQLPGGIFAKHPSVPETTPGYGHLIKSSEDNIRAIHNSLTGKQGVAEGSNPTDTVTLDIPLFIRMMEYAREDAKSDMDLHSATERMIKLASSGNTLGMDAYDQIVGMKNEQQVNEFGADGSAIGAAAQAKQMAIATKPPGSAQTSQGANTAPTSSPTTTATPTAKPGQQDVDPNEQDALDKIKANAGLKTQYDQLLQKAKTSV